MLCTFFKGGAYFHLVLHILMSKATLKAWNSYNREVNISLEKMFWNEKKGLWSSLWKKSSILCVWWTCVHRWTGFQCMLLWTKKIWAFHSQLHNVRLCQMIIIFTFFKYIGFSKALPSEPPMNLKRTKYKWQGKVITY